MLKKVQQHGLKMASFHCNRAHFIARFTKCRCTRNREPNGKLETEPTKIFKHPGRDLGPVTGVPPGNDMGPVEVL